MNFPYFYITQPDNTLNVVGSWLDQTKLSDWGPVRAASSRVSPNNLLDIDIQSVKTLWYVVKCVQFHIVVIARSKLTMLTCGYSLLSPILTSMIKNSWLIPSLYITWVAVIEYLCFLELRSTYMPIIYMVCINFLGILVNTITSLSILHLHPRKLVHNMSYTSNLRIYFTVLHSFL